MTKKQKIIIWTMVLLIAFFIGLDDEQTITPNNVGSITTRYYARIYGITLLDGLVEPNFFYEFAKLRYRFIFVTLIIGVAGVITARKRD